MLQHFLLATEMALMEYGLVSLCPSLVAVSALVMCMLLGAR
jgi:hypothetical protein